MSIVIEFGQLCIQVGVFPFYVETWRELCEERLHLGFTVMFR